MNINLSDEQLRDLLVETIFTKIPEEQRKELITTALAKLMAPERQQYGSELPSPLRQAMSIAMTKIAAKICEEEFAKTEIQDKIRALVLEAFQKVFETEREQIVTKMAYSLAGALRAS